MTASAIAIENVTKTYTGASGGPSKTALHDVSLTVPKGSIFGLLGPNGAGKSTLINILAGLVRKSAGHVTIWGFDQDINPRQSRASIGVMPQELNLDPFFSPRGALDVQAGLYGVPKRDRWTDDILRLVGLEDKADVYARTLSGGMRRRLLLGKALVHRPHVLVLDEPTAGVDIELRQMLWQNVRRLNEDGMTIILTTHYLEEAEEICDEIAIMNKGEVIAQDSTSNLLGRLDRKVLVIETDGTPRVPHMPGGITAELDAAGVLRVGYSSGQASAGDVIDLLRSAGIVMKDIRTEQAHLEDVFLDLTRAS